VPTKNNPCVRECIREYLVSVKHSAKEAPENILINRFEKIENIYQPVHFTHQLHAEMSHLAGGCQTCHHYNPPGRILTCIECHETGRKREDISKPDLKAAYHRQCIDCHRGWSHEINCVSCHAMNEGKPSNIDTKPMPKTVHPEIKTPERMVINTEYANGKIVTFNHKEHVDLFGLECQSCHSQESCIKCHDKNPDKLKSKMVHETHENCASCHDTDNNCSSCHAQKEKPGFDHGQRTGWQLNKLHSKLSCSSCHQKKGVFTGLKSKCSNCHDSWSSENFDHAITGLRLDEIHLENECADCHIDDNFTKPSCGNCHDDIEYPDFMPGTLTK